MSLKTIITCQHIRTGLFGCLLYALTFAAQALNVSHIVTIENEQSTNFDWRHIVAHPTKQQTFFVFDQQSKVKRLVKGQLQQQVILDLPEALNNPEVKLTAIILHPNFSLKESPGYHTFYTAHSEVYNKKNRGLRIPKTSINNHQFDLVINEWQYKLISTEVDVESKREIVRIASPSDQMNIQQLSFNPYLKPWQDNFGHLYIVLNQVPELAQQALYSGAILRINPERFGLRNYRVPAINPFLKNNDINNEIVLFGAKNLEKIFWQKLNNLQWFLLSKNNDKAQLHLANIGSDLTSHQEPLIWEGAYSANLQQIVWYQGRKLDELLYKLAFLKHVDNKWQLYSLTVDKDKTTFEELLTPLVNTEGSAQLGLMSNGNDELVILNKTDGVFSQINSITAPESTIQSDTSDDDSNELTTEKSSSGINTQKIFYTLIIVIVMTSLLTFIFLKVKKFIPMDPTRVLIRQQYARFYIDNDTQHVHFYHRHQKNIDYSLPFTDVASSRIFLNKQEINMIDSSPDTIFTEERQKQLSKIFSLEHRHKMVDDRSRTISLEITDKKNKSYPVCLYARKGNQRYTRVHYHDCLQALTVWCQQVSDQLHQNKNA